MVKLSTQEVVLSEDLVQALRERANKHDGIVYDAELEYDMKAAVDFLVDRGEMVEHGAGEGGLLHFYTFAQPDGVSGTPVHPGGKLASHVDLALGDVDLVPKTFSRAGENRSVDEMNEFRASINERNSSVDPDDVEAMFAARRQAAQEEEEISRKNLELHLDNLAKLDDPEHQANLHLHESERVLKLEEKRLQEAETDGITPTEAAMRAMPKNVDEQGRDLDLPKHYEAIDRHYAEDAARAEEARLQAERDALEARLEALKQPRTAREEPVQEFDTEGRFLGGESAADTLAREEAERAAAEERAVRFAAAQLELQREALDEQIRSLKAPSKAAPVEKDEEGRDKQGADMVLPEETAEGDTESADVKAPDAEPATDQHESHKRGRKKSSD